LGRFSIDTNGLSLHYRGLFSWLMLRHTLGALVAKENTQKLTDNTSRVVGFAPNPEIDEDDE
jgi:hypothetical protein